MNEELAPGLTADWLNAWLAAIGITVLVPSIRLSWTDDPIPIVRFHARDSSPVAEQVARVLPSTDAFERMAIAREHVECSIAFSRKISLPAFRERAQLVRSGARWSEFADFSLSISATDLIHDPKWREGHEDLPHGPFDPPAPKGVTLFTRLMACRKYLDRSDPDLGTHLAKSLVGAGHRVQMNGLGFDHRRLVAAVSAEGEVHVDPVVECLCFFGLALLPVRGDGRRERARGWINSPSRRGAFSWPVWKQPLDVWGIDALLDRFHDSPRGPRALARLGLLAAFHSVPYQRTVALDSTRAYASERVPWR